VGMEVNEPAHEPRISGCYNLFILMAEGAPGRKLTRQTESVPPGKAVFRAVFGYRPEVRKADAVAEKPTLSLEQVETAEQFMEALDLEMINGIYDKLQEKSGIPPEKRAAIPEKSIFLRSKFKLHDLIIGGSFQQASHFSEKENTDVRGRITLAWPSIKMNAAALNIPPWQLALDTIIHEIGHYVSYQEDMYSSKEAEDAAHRVFFKNFDSLPAGTVMADSRVGMQEVRSEKETVTAFVQKLTAHGKALNEGITERLAQEVSQEYSRRKGLSPSVILQPMSYPGERKMLDAVIIALADALSVDKDLVWRGVVRVYFSGEQGVEQFAQTISEVLDEAPALSRTDKKQKEGRIKLATQFTKNLWTRKKDPEAFLQEAGNLGLRIQDAFQAIDQNRVRAIAKSLGIT